MDSTAFKAGQMVRYFNHVAGYDIGTLRITEIGKEVIRAFDPESKMKRPREFTFRLDGSATWSSNLSITPLP